MYHVSQGDFREPVDILLEDVLARLREWRTAGYKVLLATDANQDVYEGQLARALW